MDGSQYLRIMREYEEYSSIIMTLPNMTDRKLKATHRFMEKQK